MKLLSKTTIYTSITTILLLLTGIVIVYSLILKKINHEETEHLLADKLNVIKLLEKGKPPAHFRANIGEKISIEKIPAITMEHNEFSDYLAMEEGGENEKITIRELKFQVQIKDIFYEIKIAHSLAEQDEITDYITSTIIVFLIFSLIVLLVLNLAISKSIWRPFYNTVVFIKRWSIKEDEPVQFKHTSIDEFNELNTAVHGLIKKIRKDYSHLKEFTENISHETQTPVAIISAKIELLMQENNYSENQKKLLTQAYESVQRLKKLNETLITLSRIENNQFIKVETIDLSVLIKKILDELVDFIEEKEIRVELNLMPVNKSVNLMVLTILLSNLFTNAIKHNLNQNGFISVSLNQHSLSVKNSAFNEEIEEKYFFERFKSYSTVANSLGLGLSIIKKITEILQWEIKYRFKDHIHEFEIIWAEE
jgi:signal transduction histidine kinase